MSEFTAAVVQQHRDQPFLDHPFVHDAVSPERRCEPAIVASDGVSP